MMALGSWTYLLCFADWIDYRLRVTQCLRGAVVSPVNAMGQRYLCTATAALGAVLTGANQRVYCVKFGA